MAKNGSDYEMFDLNVEDENSKISSLRVWFEKPKYNKNDKVFVLENGLLYKAIIRKTDLQNIPVNNISDTALPSNYYWGYYVHFHGWNARHDRWMKDDEIVPYNEECWKMIVEESELKLKGVTEAQKMSPSCTSKTPVKTMKSNNDEESGYLTRRRSTRLSGHKRGISPSSTSETPAKTMNKKIYDLMDEIEVILWKRKKLKSQYRNKNDKNIFNLAWSFLVGYNINALNANGFKTPHNFKKGKGICTTPVEEQKIALYRKTLYRLCKEIIEMIDPIFANGEFVVNFSCMNSQTHHCKKHIDHDDISYQYALALGDYENASLRLYNEKDEIIDDYDYKRKILKLDGRLPHELISEGFSGTRFCIIWFKTTDQSKMKADEIFKAPHYVFGDNES